MPKVLIIVLTCAAVGLFVIAWMLFREHSLQAVSVQSASGELVTYEAARQDLIIRTKNGDRHFRLREDTPVHEGARVLMPGDLTSASGCPAKVWYQDRGATWIASDVRVSCRRIVPHGDPRSF
jgi:hypothetical protein